jgi:HD superfamily phosphodiesterase
LIGVRGMLVRNIVSDADKLDALGMHGLHRCLSYIKETDKNLSDDEAKNILRPFNEKNLKIRAQYLRTSYAKKLGQYLLTEMNVDKM